VHCLLTICIHVDPSSSVYYSFYRSHIAAICPWIPERVIAPVVNVLLRQPKYRSCSCSFNVRPPSERLNGTVNISLRGQRCCSRAPGCAVECVGPDTVHSWMKTTAIRTRRSSSLVYSQAKAIKSCRESIQFAFFSPLAAAATTAGRTVRAVGIDWQPKESKTKSLRWCAVAMTLILHIRYTANI
jgi:hypothetical protein